MTDIVKTNDVQIAKLDGFSSVEDMKGLAQTLIDSKLVPSTLNTPEKVITVILQGKELGFGAITSINNINNIQGKATLSIHAINAKVTQRGIKFQTIKDCVPIKDNTGKIVDLETVIVFYVPLEKPINGEFYLKEEVSFTWTMASDMGLTSKDNWKKMKKIMMWTRCFTIGARRVASDAILGMYETTEWSDVVNQNYNINEEGQVTILN